MTSEQKEKFEEAKSHLWSALTRLGALKDDETFSPRIRSLFQGCYDTAYEAVCDMENEEFTGS